MLALLVMPCCAVCFAAKPPWAALKSLGGPGIVPALYQAYHLI